MIKSLPWGLFLALIFISCSSSLQYQPTSSLSDEEFISRGEHFSGMVPEGWFSSPDSSITKSLEVWLLREDLGALITFQEIHLDSVVLLQTKEDGLAFIGEITKAFYLTDSSATLTENMREYELNKLPFCSFELTISGTQKRIVLFSVSERYFECEVSPLKGAWNKEEIKKLFTVQQSVLSSLKVKKQSL